MKNTNIEEKRFQNFREEVLKYNLISTEDLWMLIRANIKGYMGRRFFNDTLKQKYYTFWIKRLQGEGLITLQGWGCWKVKKEKC